MLPNLLWEKIVETDASNIGYGDILKQIDPNSKQEYLIRFYSDKWKGAQLNYSVVVKEHFAVVKCVLKFQDDLHNQTFLIKTDCSSVQFMFIRDFRHDVSKQMFARWQAHLAPFDFIVQHIKGIDNHLLDFLTREYLSRFQE